MHRRLRVVSLRQLARVRHTVVQRRILHLREMRVLLDHDLAALYGVTTKALNQAVTRNRSRFPPDFMFRLTPAETRDLRSQIVTSSGGHGGRRHRPRVFSEQGVAMLSSVLRSRRAIAVNIAIMRAFARLREMLASNAELRLRLDELERRYDGQFQSVFDAIRDLVDDRAAPEVAARRIGFRTDERTTAGRRTGRRDSAAV